VWECRAFFPSGTAFSRIGFSERHVNTVTSPQEETQAELSRLRAQVAQLQEQLRRMELGSTEAERLAAIVEGSNDAIISKTLDGIVTSWNRAAETTFGYTAEEMIGQPISRLIPPDRPNDLASILGHIRRGERVKYYETVRRHKDGRLLQVSLTVSPVYNRAGEIVGASKIAHNVTERKRMEAALRQSEERFRTTFEQAAVGIAHVGLDGQWLRVNQRLCDIVGYDREELLKLTFADITHPDDIDDDWARAHALLRGELNTYTLEKRYVRKDGSPVWISLTVSILRDETGKPQNFISIVEDISTRKATEEALRRSEDQFRLVAEAIPGILFMTNAAGGNTYTNRYFQEYAGLSADQLLGQGWMEVIHPEDLERTTREWEACVRENRPYEIEYRFRRYDNTYRWFLGRGVLLRDATTHVTCWLGICVDIEEQKRAERALRESEERFRTLFEAAPIANYLIDPDNSAILDSNEQAAVQLGYKREDLARMRVLDVEDQLTPERIHARYTKLLGGERLKFETVHRTQQGARRNVLITTQAVQLNHQPVIYTSALDITERKQAEQKLLELNATLEQRVEERTSELAEANRELEAFSYSVSHDLRAPLRSIDGFGQRLLARYSGRVLDDTAVDYLQRMTRASQRMGQLIEDLLNLSRLGRAGMAYQLVNLSALGESIAEEQRSRDGQRHVAVQIEDGLTACGDPRLLRIALENLFGNAWKYTSKKAEPLIQFGAMMQDGEQVYYVQDNGAGFDMAHAQHLFAPFQRLHRASEFEGNGIGLAIVQRIIHRHGGRIWAEAEPDKGATFFFTLPAKERKAK
jgi:PAS domain S-box-containing protein